MNKMNDENKRGEIKTMTEGAGNAGSVWRHAIMPCAMLIGLIVSVPFAHAQESAEEIRRERRDAIEELERTEKLWKDYREPGWRFKHGSWISTAYNASSQDDRDASIQDALDHTWDNDMRIYTTAKSGTGKTTLYARAGTQYTDNSRASAAIAKNNWTQFSLEMAYLEKKFGGAAFKQNLIFGRQFISVENSLAFALVADALKYKMTTRRQVFEAFFARQTPGDDNIDFLAPRAGRSKRWFFGSQYFWNYTQNHALNLFGVWNKDANDDAADASGQRHRFDSLYLGGTVSGKILTRLHYDMQVVKEFGETFSDSNSAINDAEVKIDAYAFTAGLKYYFSGTLNLLAHTEYLYGSGDGDAVGNVYSTDGGSGSLAGSGIGGKDRRFISFGGKNLGFALAPSLTNLHVYKSGFSLKPFGWSESRLWNDMRIHPQVYFYKRDKSSGATSDPYIVRGDGASSKIGHEFDVDVAWRLMSDVKYALKFGKFYPGAAYVGKSSETVIRLKISVDL